MIGKKQVAIGVTSLAVAGAAFVPAFAAAGGSLGVASEAAGVTPAVASAAFTQQGPDDGDRPALGRGRGRGHFGRGMRGVLGSVIEQFDVTTEDYRAAVMAVRDQFGPETRPDVDRPLDDDERAQLAAHATAQRAAIASELGIDGAAFEQVFEDAKAEAQAAHEARRSERRQALADALGVTVEDLQEAFESLRGQFQQQQPSSSSQTSA